MAGFRQRRTANPEHLSPAPCHCMSWTPPLHLFAYVGVYSGALFLALHRMKKAGGRFPVPEDVKVARQPGEHLTRQLRKIWDKMPEEFAVHFLLPLVLGAIPLWAGQWLPRSWSLGVVIAAAVLLIAGLLTTIRRLVRRARKIRALRMAIYGERVTGDALEELKTDGCRVYHDVPCVGGGGRFNLDHVVVGGGAVTVVETKTRRKKCGKEGGADHRVIYDGTALCWPWGADAKPVEQASRSAQWLEERLKKELNLTVAVRPVLSIPGWFVESRSKSPVLAVNQKQLATTIRHQCRGDLTPEQEELIARHLAAMCRDVDYMALE